ncbi:hypothetical protein BH23BAC4_BH23BAC4_03110 [soil metagenome]
MNRFFLPLALVALLVSTPACDVFTLPPIDTSEFEGSVIEGGQETLLIGQARFSSVFRDNTVNTLVEIVARNATEVDSQRGYVIRIEVPGSIGRASYQVGATGALSATGEISYKDGGAEDPIVYYDAVSGVLEVSDFQDQRIRGGLQMDLQARAADSDVIMLASGSFKALRGEGFQ